MAFRDLTGVKFDRLSVIKRVENTKHGQSRWLCKCDCGNEVVVRGYCLTSKHTKSCGCLSVESSVKNNTTHGKTGTKVHKTWMSIKGRCCNKNHQYYNIYGGRGIKVSDEWLNSFEQFYNDMGEPPTNKHQIDRINSDGDYCKENCRWVTPQQNTMNTSKRKGCTSKYKGVYKSHGKWACSITKDGVTFDLGRYDNEDEAGAVYNKKASELFG